MTISEVQHRLQDHGYGGAASVRRYLVLLTIIAILPMVVLVAARDAVGVMAFGWLTNDSDYLAAIRNSDLGCRTLRMRRAEVVAVGDSHTYAAWDFEQLGDAMRARVGACALGGLYVETVPSILQGISRLPTRPRLVLLGLSPRMFWDSPTREQQTRANLDIVKEIDVGIAPTIETTSQLLAARGQRDRLASAIAQRELGLNELALHTIEDGLDRAGARLPTLDNWIQRLGDTKITTAAREAVKKICSAAVELKIPLVVIHLPESPYLEGMYPPGAWTEYVDMLAGLAACARHVIAEPARSFGLSNRDYVDRFLVSDPSYSLWRSQIPLVDGRVFDPDHMNPLGARRFTREIILRHLPKDVMTSMGSRT
jgi:hypothetical protein